MNKSLSNLKKVISELLKGNNANGAFRSNILTQMMKDSIGGNSKTLMIVNVSPADENLTESKNSLEWARDLMKVKQKA